MKSFNRVIYCDRKDSFFKKIARHPDGFSIEAKAPSFSGSPQKFARQNGASVLLLKIKKEFDIKHQEWLSKSNGSVPIILISQNTTIETAIQAIQYGIFDTFSVSQPVEFIRKGIQDALALKNAETLRLTGRSKATLLIGNDPQIVEANRAVREDPGRVPVLFLGEVGTGKEHLATGMHSLFGTAAGTLVRHDCRTLRLISRYDGLSVPELIDIHLQPLRKKNETATLILTHLEDLAAEHQVEILDSWKNTTVRILACMEERKSGSADLTPFSRARIIRIPPLRQRKEDVPLLAGHFLARISARRGIPVKELTKETLALMKDYLWPGNVQELSNVIENMVIVEASPVLTAETWRICRGQGTLLASDAPNQFDALLEAVLVSGESAWKSGQMYDRFMQKMEKVLIDLVLPKVDHNQALAAKILGISRNTLRQRLKSA